MFVDFSQIITLKNSKINNEKLKKEEFQYILWVNFDAFAFFCLK